MIKKQHYFIIRNSFQPSSLIGELTVFRLLILIQRHKLAWSSPFLSLPLLSSSLIALRCSEGHGKWTNRLIELKKLKNGYWWCHRDSIHGNWMKREKIWKEEMPTFFFLNPIDLNWIWSNGKIEQCGNSTFFFLFLFLLFFFVFCFVFAYGRMTPLNRKRVGIIL